MLNAMEIVLIDIGGSPFALPLQEVNHIATLPPDFRHSGPDTEDYFTFEGNPLPFISAWNVLGKATLYKEYADILAMLPARRQDHLDWMAALKQSLLTGAPFTKARDPHDCAFGKWYYSYQAEDRRVELLLGRFEQPHALIHNLAETLLGMAGDNRRDEALAMLHEMEKTTLKKLLDIFDHAEVLMHDLQRRIALIVEKSGEHFALGADSIRTLVTIPLDRIRWHKAAAGDSLSRPALFILDDGHVVNCLNWQQFCPPNPPLQWREPAGDAEPAPLPAA